MSETQQEHNKKQLSVIQGKPNNIQIDAIKTKQAYDLAYSEKGIIPTSKTDYPRSGQGYRAIQRLLEFGALVKPEKQKIKKIIHTMVVQPVTIDGEKKYALYYNGHYLGLDGWGSEIASATFNEGYHYKPKLQFVVYDIGNPFDPKTGERKGTWQPVGYSIEHDIFIPETPKERRKFLNDLIKPLDTTNTVFSYRQANSDNNHSSTHSQISFDNLCDLSFEQLRELSEKTYYKYTTGNLFDKEGIRFAITMNV